MPLRGPHSLLPVALLFLREGFIVKFNGLFSYLIFVLLLLGAKNQHYDKESGHCRVTG